MSIFADAGIYVMSDLGHLVGRQSVKASRQPRPLLKMFVFIALSAMRMELQFQVCGPSAGGCYLCWPFEASIVAHCRLLDVASDHILLHILLTRCVAISNVGCLFHHQFHAWLCIPCLRLQQREHLLESILHGSWDPPDCRISIQHCPVLLLRWRLFE